MFSFAQKEANNWYFGEQAGLDFNNGAPVALTNNALINNEYHGTASIADTNGNLLFYTDGRKILNKNHELMLNGILFNQYNSGGNRLLIVPKPGSSSIYYLFYTGILQPLPSTYIAFGLTYSEIDMTLDNGLGGVTSSKNVSLNANGYDLTATVHANGHDIWLLTYKKSSRTFYSYLISGSGINVNPITNIVGVSQQPNASDPTYIKLSPSGKKLILIDYDTFLYDFDNFNGNVASNPLILNENYYPWPSYAEFSSSGKVLYVSGAGWAGEGGALWQYDLNAPDIRNSEVTLAYGLNQTAYGDLQIGTDQKIYMSILYNDHIGAIESPETIGPGCSLNTKALYLNGGYCNWELPHFIQSYFNVTIQVENVCLGESSQFYFNTSIEYDSLLWDFGDGTTSSNEAPVHTYASAGTYTVTLTATKGSETSIDSDTVTIYKQPTATQPPSMLICDEDGDGYVYFDLTLQDDAILNGQDPANFEVLYYTAPFDFSPPIADPTNFRNIFAYEGELMYARVKNRLNPQCEAITTFDIGPISEPNQAVSRLALCDDTSVGTDFDGLVQIDLTQKEVEILNNQDPQNFRVSYFTDALLQNEILDPTQYQNTDLTETIYVVVSNNFSSYCSGETQFDLEVFPLPMVPPVADLKQCDDDLDGYSAFNLNEVLAEISPNYMNETITFHESQADAVTDINVIGNTIMYLNQVVSYDALYARIENTHGCFRTFKVNLIVTTTQIPSTFMRDFHACDDDQNGVSSFDFSDVNSDIEALFPIGQDLVINYYQNLSNALAETNPITDISNYRNTGFPYRQSIYVRVDSKIDNDCIGLGAHINLYVDPLPEFTVDAQQIVCSSDPTFTVVLDPLEVNPTESFNYSWVLNGVEISSDPTLSVSSPGTYSITLTKTDGSACSRTKEFFVNASELATISTLDLTIVQLSDNNSITINTSHLGLGDYEFALDHSTESYQDEPYFDHVSAGAHTLYVKDKKGCGIAQLEVFIMGFPKFFTPNDDGFNDTWNIKGIGFEYTQNSKVYIFDRYGKLLKQLDPRGEGWNGTFNGDKLGTSDYWFVIELVDTNGIMTTYRGHFSLVR